MYKRAWRKVGSTFGNKQAGAFHSHLFIFVVHSYAVRFRTSAPQQFQETGLFQVNSKKYGVDLIHFTHAKNTAIHSSTKIDGKLCFVVPSS